MLICAAATRKKKYTRARRKEKKRNATKRPLFHSFPNHAPAPSAPLRPRAWDDQSIRWRASGRSRQGEAVLSSMIASHSSFAAWSATPALFSVGARARVGVRVRADVAILVVVWTSGHLVQVGHSRFLKPGSSDSGRSASIFFDISCLRPDIRARSKHGSVGPRYLSGMAGRHFRILPAQLDGSAGAGPCLKSIKSASGRV